MIRRLAGSLEQTRPLWTLALLPLFVLGQGRFLWPGLILWTVFWLAAGAGTGRWGPRSPVAACLAVWLLLIPVTLAVTPDFALTQEHLGYFLAELIAFYTVATWVDSAARARWAAWGLLGLGVGLALLTVLAALRGGRLALPAGVLEVI